uniref:MADF domain-containing protein n=1 Tax=Meloidogyne incognita TaxID=6306 RepID=A0A914KYE6_MELIC
METQPLSDKEKFYLISLIRDKPTIWDSSHGLSWKNKHDEFNSLVDDMSKAFKREFTVTSLRNSWRILNICFCRERRKPDSKWKFFQEMAFLNNTNTPKQKSIDEKPKKRRRVKKEEMSEETENNNKNEGFDLINSLIDLNEGNLTTDDSPSDLTMLDAEFGNNGGENNINDEDSGNEGLQIIQDAESAENLVEEQQSINNTNNGDNTKNNNNDANKSVATAIIHETPNKTIDTTKTFTNINETNTTILEDTTEDDSLLLGKMVVCTHRILKSEGMDCEAIGLEKSVYDLLINYKQMRAEYAKKIKGEK